MSEEQVRTHQAETGKVRRGHVRTGKVWTGQKFGQFKFCSVPLPHPNCSPKQKQFKLGQVKYVKSSLDRSSQVLMGEVIPSILCGVPIFQ